MNESPSPSSSVTIPIILILCGVESLLVHFTVLFTKIVTVSGTNALPSMVTSVRLFFGVDTGVPVGELVGVVVGSSVAVSVGSGWY